MCQGENRLYRWFVTHMLVISRNSLAWKHSLAFSLNGNSFKPSRVENIFFSTFYYYFVWNIHLFQKLVLFRKKAFLFVKSRTIKLFFKKTYLQVWWEYPKMWKIWYFQKFRCAYNFPELFELSKNQGRTLQRTIIFVWITDLFVCLKKRLKLTLNRNVVVKQ